MEELRGKVALVTGAGQGVGQGIALALADQGATVAVAGRTRSKLEATCEEVARRGGRAIPVACDVGEADQILACVEHVVSELGTVDILVNNAQAVPLGTILEVTDEMFELGWRTGPLAALRFMRACYPYLKGGGVVVNIGTGAALRPDMQGYGPYAAVKEAIRSLTRAAACEWGKDGIRVLAIIPMAMSPGMEAWSKFAPEQFEALLASIPLGRAGDCERDIGRAVAFLVSPAASYITGTTVTIDGGHAYLR
ncbi:MAG: SDR family oxidoreductase [Candidatus Dadabacteria bacterium]|nr:MAG: SDR family oxidoreductase [Candidatus Dadabacteria bacterium]